MPLSTMTLNFSCIYMLTMKVRAQVALVEVMEDCEETLNALGNGYPCNKPGTERGIAQLKPKPGQVTTEDRL